MAMSGLRSAHPYGKLALVVMLGVSVGVTVFSGTHTKGTHAATSSTIDFNGRKINTANSTAGAYKAIKITETRVSINYAHSSTANPYSFAGIGGSSTTAQKYTVASASASPYDYTIKGSTWCRKSLSGSGCSGFNPQTTNFAAGATRTISTVTGYTVTVDFIYLYSAPKAPSTVTQSLSGTTVTLKWSGASALSGVKQYQVFNNGSLVLTTSATAGTFNLGYSAKYAFAVKAVSNAGNVSAASATVTGTTVAAPPPPPPAKTPVATPKKTPAPTAAPPKPGQGSAPSDTTPPQPPANFKAAADDGNVGITLSWNAASDPSGISGYGLESSTDRTNWTSVDSGLKDTSFDDQSTSFNTHYYYRLTATDNAGNTSNYALADASTGGFESNASGGSGLTVTSDDKLAVVTLPSGALDDEADCQLVKDQTAAKTTQSELVGPYKLLCKDQQGNNVDSFQQDVSWTINLSHKEKKYTKLSVALLDADGNATDAKAKLNSKSDVLAFTASASGPFVVLGTLKKGLPWSTIISIILVLLAAGGGIGFLIYRQRNKQNYDDYLRRKYYDF
jgi:hypothetical protein